MKNTKRIVDYTLGITPRLQDLREIVAETQQLSGESRLEFPRFVGQRDEEYLHIVITEDGSIE
jgi:hypothetical protein